MPNTKDKNPEVAAFEAALLRSVDQAISGQLGRVHTPEQIVARRRGRPVGRVCRPPEMEESRQNSR